MTACNAALFVTDSAPGFAADALAPYLPTCRVISDADSFLPSHMRLGAGSSGLNTVPMDSEAVYVALKQAAPTALVVDMRWSFDNARGVTGIQTWGAIAQRLAETEGIPVISVYDQDLIIGEQMQAALQVHEQILSASGLYPNPYWIPDKLLQGAPLDEQLFFMLGRIVPDYAGQAGRRLAGSSFAHGSTPSWLASSRSGLGLSPAEERWHVHCLGQLKVYVGNRLVEWKQPGGAVRKTRTLFAYLLTSGDKGAHAEQIGELLWPEGGSEEVKRTRLHHTVAMLRRTLGDPAAVIRSGEYYRLNAPKGSWIDIDTYEQLCRRALSLFKRGETDAALRTYAACDRLYAGDLFEDLPVEYVRSDTDDWCMPRRIWLREMAVKVLFDYARLCLSVGRVRDALDHSQRALALDPTSEGANMTAIQSYAAQGRTDAMHRQYRQYRAALETIGATEGPEIKAVYRDLSRQKTTS